MTLIDFGRGLREQVAELEQRVIDLRLQGEAAELALTGRIERAADLVRTLIVHIRARTAEDIAPTVRIDLADRALDVLAALQPPAPAAAPEPQSAERK